MPSRRSLLVASLICIVPFSLALAGTAQASGTPDERALVQEINEARRSHGLHAVRQAAWIKRGARTYARFLLKRNLLVHASVAGMAENLAWGTGSYRSPRAIVRRWLASPRHRAVLLWPPARRIGIGLVDGSFQGHPSARVFVVRLAA